MSFRDENPWDLVELLSENVFWVEKGMEEAKEMIWKIHYLPFKIENPLISQVRY